MGVGEVGNVGVHGYVTGDRSGDGILDCGWSFSRDDCGVSDEENTEVDEVSSLVGLVDSIWSAVVLNSEENTGGKGGDAGNVWNFGGAV